MIYIWLIFGLVLVVKGADFFIDASVLLAQKFNISQMLIGLTIVSIGTSLPEIIISIIAAFNGSTEKAMGIIVGSNNFNMLFILGAAALFSPFAVKDKTISRDLWLSLISGTIILMLNFLFVGFIPVWIAWVLNGAFILYMLTLFKEAKKVQQYDVNDDGLAIESIPKNKFILKLGLGTVGCAMIIFGSDITVEAAAALAYIIGMSERVIGLTILGIGTSLPELVTTLVACKKGEQDIALGNILGSNIFHLLLMSGLVGIISPLVVNREILIDLSIFIIGCLLLLYFIRKNEKIGRILGGTLCVLYVTYVLAIL